MKCHNEQIYVTSSAAVESHYFDLLAKGASPQEARSVLPNSTKTEITLKANYREWRNFFRLRVDKAAHPQMREVTVPLLKELQSKLPVVFDDIFTPEEIVEGNNKTDEVRLTKDFLDDCLATAEQLKSK